MTATGSTADGSTRSGPPRASAAAARTWLFVPGDAGPRLDKAETSVADEVIVDLEDAVDQDGKEHAREALVAWLSDGHRSWVRVNAPGTSWHEGDVAALVRLPGLRGIVVPKADDPQALAGLRASLGEDLGLIGLVETAEGVRRCDEVASSGVDRLAVGTIDLALDLGCEESWDALLLARSTLVLASRCAGLASPVDGVTSAVDAGRVAHDTRRAKGLGFGGKLCIHPAQLLAAREGLRPTPDEVAWARNVLAATSGRGAAGVDGHMVDLPVLLRAQKVLTDA